MKRTSLIVLLVILAVLAFFAWQWRYSPLFSGLFGSSNPGQLIASADYLCDGGKAAQAQFYNGPAQTPQPQPGEPPVPAGWAQVSLDDGRELTLQQTISADGGRYANSDGSVVFWSKGRGAFVEEGGTQTYANCIETAQDPGGLPQAYANGKMGFSIRYPQNFTPDAKYVYQEMGPGKSISGVKFTVDPAIASGTNLSSDSYLSVEQIASSSACTAGLFLENATPSTLTEGTMTYSYATSTGAAAGNRYDEQVFALPGTNPCLSVRYFVHYGAIENYPPGAVKEFDYQALVNQFDAIRKTLTVNQ